MFAVILFFYFIIFVVAIIINIWIAKKFEEIAKYKGHENEPIFLMCFFLGLAGYLYVIALPDIERDDLSLRESQKTLESIAEIKKQLVEINSKINN